MLLKNIVQGLKITMELLNKLKKLKLNILTQKFPNYSQQLCTFVYGCLIEFPRSNIEYETVTTATFKEPYTES